MRKVLSRALLLPLLVMALLALLAFLSAAAAPLPPSAAAVGWAAAAASTQPALPDLLTAAPISPEHTGGPPNARGVTRSRDVGVRLDLLAPAAEAGGAGPDGATQPRRARLELFPDAVYTALFERVTLDETSGGYTWLGRLEEAPLSEIILTVLGESMTASVFTLDAQYEVAGTGGRYEVRQVDRSAGLPEAEPLVPEDAPPAISTDPAAPQVDLCTDINLMIVYTGAAKAYADANYGGIDAFILNRVQDINTGYQNSNVNQRVHLVYKNQVSWTQTPDSDANPWTVATWQDALNKLTNPSDGAMDEVHAWRNTHKADETLLLVDVSHGACGIGWLMQNLSGTFENKAFAVVDAWCANTLHTQAHELGHNMGSHHDHASAGTDTTIYPYSFGFRRSTGDGSDFRTMMAYDAGCAAQAGKEPCPRINYWSNPDMTVNGFVIGVPGTGATAADNHRSLNQTCGTVANFRVGEPLTNKLYLPMITQMQGWISGRVTYQGGNPGSLELLLKKCPTASGSCSVIMTTTSAADGNYRFANPPALAAGWLYYVQYSNSYGANPNVTSYLGGWFGPDITSYTAGQQIAGGDFDVADIVLSSPTSGATVGLPYTFSWVRRTTTSDSYVWHAFLPPFPGSPSAMTSLLGYVNGVTITKLPAAFVANQQYAWTMWAYASSDSMGYAHYLRFITFSSLAAQAELKDAAEMQPMAVPDKPR